MKKSISPVVAAFVSMTTLLVSMASAQDLETAATIVAVQIRKQGHPCSEPKPAQKQLKANSKKVGVWLLECKEAKYRVTLKPNRAAVVEVLKEQ